MWDYGLMYEIHLNVTGKIIRSSATGLPLASKNCIKSFLTPIAAEGFLALGNTFLLNYAQFGTFKRSNDTLS